MKVEVGSRNFYSHERRDESMETMKMSFIIKVFLFNSPWSVMYNNKINIVT